MMKTFEELYYEAPSFWRRGAVKTARLAEIAALLPNTVKSLLDVGCGNGEFGHYLTTTRPEIRVTGVDRSETALSYVRFEKHVAPISAIPFEPRQFDAVSCLQVLEHLHAPTSIVALAELSRVSRELLIIEVPFDEDIAANRTQCPRCQTEFNVDLHLDRFDERRLRTLFDAHGFQFAEMVFPDRKQHLRGIDAAIIALSAARAKRPPFLSPICPLCGYSEGDRTSQSLLERSEPPVARHGIRRVVGSFIKRHWPRVEVRGYSVACVYRRTH